MSAFANASKHTLTARKRTKHTHRSKLLLGFLQKGKCEVDCKMSLIRANIRSAPIVNTLYISQRPKKKDKRGYRPHTQHVVRRHIAFLSSTPINTLENAVVESKYKKIRV